MGDYVLVLIQVSLERKFDCNFKSVKILNFGAAVLEKAAFYDILESKKS